MDNTLKIAISPPVQLGGTLFTPEQLMKIGSVVGSDSKIEMTGFGQLYIEIPFEEAELIEEQLRSIGLKVYPVGFVTKGLIACHFCKGAEEAGLEIAQTLNQAIAGIAIPAPIKVGYAGCALGTSEPLLKDIAVVKMKNTFDIYVGGNPKGVKVTLGSKLLSGLTEDRLVPVITTVLEFYKANAKPKEKFNKFVERISLEQLRQVAA
ncbi:nitrite/sulfite reductase ferredoxin-like protein [Fontibacillus phaseoli]|uniref:Nitrite/sulfite reductase ferredoxin-like protein n=1 Tax=Fontibacillus phaseoli TaxID=1416533 RepID=A0A369BTT6_9BACL|nr:nitrite reductase [Fontibacillus phaseoli]RCX23827.1 nitrite/sulfite reductase ferredoxin-like protein [Fontibacillus phaseoli]